MRILSTAALSLAFVIGVGAPFAAAGDAARVSLTLKDHKFLPAEPMAPAGKPITIDVSNLDSTPSEFESKTLRVEKVVPGGGKIAVQIRPLGPGRCRFLTGAPTQPARPASVHMDLHFLAFAHFLSGKFEEAVARARDAAASRPELSSAHCVLACSLVRLGRKEEAQRAVLEMQQSMPASGSNNLKQFLQRFADAGDRKQISVALGEAGWNEK